MIITNKWVRKPFENASDMWSTEMMITKNQDLENHAFYVSLPNICWRDFDIVTGTENLLYTLV